MPRKEHQYHYIYKITNLKNNKYYIGMHSTSNLDDGYMGGGTRIRNSIRKHGKEIHQKEILEYLPDRISLAAKEKEIVNEDLLKDPLCMNLILGGGCGGFISEEHRLMATYSGIFSIKKKIDSDSVYKKRFQDRIIKTTKKCQKEGKYIRVNDKNAFYNKKHSVETKKKIGKKNSIHQLGEKNSQFGTCWIIHNELGNKKIRKEEICEYLKNGWRQGRK